MPVKKVWLVFFFLLLLLLSTLHMHVCVCARLCAHVRSMTGSWQPALVCSRFIEEQSGLEPTTGAQYICPEPLRHHMTPAQMKCSSMASILHLTAQNVQI